MRKYLYVLLVAFVVALILRLYPTLISGLPFSTDGWSCIRNAELMVEHTPVSLGGNSMFDGYNNYWPASSLFGAIFSLVTGLEVIDAMAFGIPLAGTLTIPLFYILVQKVTQNTYMALFSTVLLATAYPYAMFTAGVTKETFANPLYICILLIFLLAPSWKRTLLFTATSTTLVLSHHMASLLTIGILAALTLACFYSKDPKVNQSIKSNVGLIVLMCGLTAGYFVFFAHVGFRLSLASNDLLAVGAYQLVVLTIILFFTSKHGFPSRKQVLLGSTIAIALVCCLVVFLTQKSLVIGAPTLPLHYVIYFLPYIIALPVMMLGFGGLYERQSGLLFPLFWIAFLVGLVGFAVFSGSSMGLPFLSRTLNFLILPLMLLTGSAFYKLYVFSKGLRFSRFLRVGILIIVLFVASLNSYSMFASVTQKEQFLGYFWLYHEPEFAASKWALTYNFENYVVAGDVKVAYLLKDYFKMKVDVFGGLNYLDGSGSAPELLFVYPEMYTNGYVLYSGNVLPLNQNWTHQLPPLNTVYDNSMVDLYVK